MKTAISYTFSIMAQIPFLPTSAAASLPMIMSPLWPWEQLQ